MKKAISPLQAARAAYSPKLPKVLSAKSVAVKKGRATKSVSDQAAIQKLFPHTYGQPEVSFGKGAGIRMKKPIRMGLVLSGLAIQFVYDGLTKLGILG